MTFCARCGGELPATARFCPVCGRPVEPEVGPPAPPPTAPIWSGFRLPDWVRCDWPLVGLGVAVMLGLLFAASALVGVIAAVVVFGSLSVVPCGAGVGAHLAFAAFGARTAVGCRSPSGAAFAISFLPLFWALVGGLVTEAALRFAWPRLVDDRRRRIAYAAKLAFACGVALGVIAGLVDGGDPGGGSRLGSSLNGGEVWFYTTVLAWFWSWMALRRRAIRVLGPAPDAAARFRSPTLDRWRRMAGEGALAFVALAGGLAVVGIVFALAVADGGADRLGIIVGFPIVGFSFGAVLADAAMGAALAGAGSHTSLLQFGLPAAPGSGAAPAWLFATMLLAPAVVALAVGRRLGRVTLSAYVGPTVAGGWSPFQTLERSMHPVAVVARPNPASVLGLALLWGLAGGLGAAFLWASRHNARWKLDGAGVAPAAPTAPGAQEAGAVEDPPAEGDPEKP